MQYQQHIIYTAHKGYSLVEVLVAVALLMFAIVGPMTIAFKGAQSTLYARQQNTAFFLAQEGVSIINLLRNDAGLAHYNTGTTDAWTWIDTPSLAPCKASYGCNIDMADVDPRDNVTSCEDIADCTLSYQKGSGRVFYKIGTGVDSPYRRIITLAEVTTDEVSVTSRVEWDSTLLGGTQSVVVNTSLFNLYKE